MKAILFLALACASMTNLSAWENWNSSFQPKYNQQQGQTDYERQSLHNQREALKNQERMIAQQNPHPGSKAPLGGRAGW